MHLHVPSTLKREEASIGVTTRGVAYTHQDSRSWRTTHSSFEFGHTNDSVYMRTNLNRSISMISFPVDIFPLKSRTWDEKILRWSCKVVYYYGCTRNHKFAVHESLGRFCGSSKSPRTILTSNILRIHVLTLNLRSKSKNLSVKAESLSVIWDLVKISVSDGHVVTGRVNTCI